MTLANTCDASNMMQNFKKQLIGILQQNATTTVFWIAMFQCSSVVLKTLNLILKHKVAMHNLKIWHLFHIVLLQISSATFLPNII